MARRAILIRRSEIDLAYVSACVGSLVIGAIFVVVNMTSIIGIIVIGLFMIFDESYLSLFKPWIIFSIMYLAVMATLIAYRLLSSPAVVVVETPASHGRPFLPVFTKEPGRRAWWADTLPSAELLPAPVVCGFTCDRSRDASPRHAPLLARPGALRAATAFIWSRAVNGRYHAECAGCLITIEETGPDRWSWLVAEKDAILYQGQAPSFSQAEETIRTLLTLS